MPKLNIILDEWSLREAAARHWRDNRTGNYNSQPTPFDEPTMQALIKAIVEEFNSAVARAIPEFQENDGMAHLSVFHPADGWVPLCKAGMFVTGTCLECTSKAKPQ